MTQRSENYKLIGVSRLIYINSFSIHLVSLEYSAMLPYKADTQVNQDGA